MIASETVVVAALDAVIQDPGNRAVALDAIMEMLADAHNDGAVEGLKTYAEALENTDPLAVATLHGFAKALRISAGRIHRNYEDGKLLAALDPDGQLDAGGHDS